MKRRLSCLIAASLLLAAPAFAQPADDTAPVPPGHWFVPPGKEPGSTAPVNTGVGPSAAETVTVIGQHKSRSWRSHVVSDHLQRPLAPNAAHPFAKQVPYCNSTLRTVGGQPASEGDMLTGVGAGSC